MSIASPLSEFTRVSKYTHIVGDGETAHRENWGEQVKRMMDMHRKKLTQMNILTPEMSKEVDCIEDMICKKQILGSQRALQFGGEAILIKHARIYNCSGTYADRLGMFKELMWLLLCGCGAGVNISKKFVSQIKPVKKREGSPKTYVIPDTIEGWGDAVGVLINSFADGSNPIVFDYDQIRPKGSRLITTCSVAPGPAPLSKSLSRINKFLCSITDNLKPGEEVKLTPFQVYEIMLWISNAVLAGGVRRSAMLVLFDVDDKDMMTAKTGDWYKKAPWRQYSNNSAILIRGKTSYEQFKELTNSTKQFGEPGWVWADSEDVLFNPCGEVGLYPRIKYNYVDEESKIDEIREETGWAFCNLCDINMTKCPSESDFYTACKYASILGTIQATYTDFKYLGRVTKMICERDPLLGIGMTGCMDNPSISFNPDILRKGASVVREWNAIWAKLLRINPATRTTCVKPSGTTSCLLDVSNGIHPQYAPRYFRRVRMNKDEPLVAFLQKYVPGALETSSGEPENIILSFPSETPKRSITSVDLSAKKFIEMVILVQENWVMCGKDTKLIETLDLPSWLTHNVSNTVKASLTEWDDIVKQIFDNRDVLSGNTLMTESGDRDYELAPYQRVFNDMEIIKRYKTGGLLASGFIIETLKDFPSIYSACYTLLHGLDEKIPDLNDPTTKIDSIERASQACRKRLWIDRARNFASKYFNNDIVKMTYCIKDVDAWKKWCDLSRIPIKNIPWSEFVGQPKQLTVDACNGGHCEFTTL